MLSERNQPGVTGLIVTVIGLVRVQSEAVIASFLCELESQCHGECRPAGLSRRAKLSPLINDHEVSRPTAVIAAPICRRVRPLQRDAADLLSTLSAAVRARDRGHVSLQCERHEKNRPNFDDIRERSGDRLSGLARKQLRVWELWPDIEDVRLEHSGKYQNTARGAFILAQLRELRVGQNLSATTVSPQV
jgi:hypothetical protein